MHELGITFYIIKDVKNVAVENNVSKVHSVSLEIGEVSGIIDEYLEDCWNWAVKKEGELLQDAKLICESLKAITYCTNCNKTYETVKYGKICPYCKSEKTYLKVGTECNIKQIEAS